MKKRICLFLSWLLMLVCACALAEMGTTGGSENMGDMLYGAGDLSELSGYCNIPVYNAKPQMPDIILKDGDNELILGRDYEIDGSFEAPTDAGNYSVLLHGIGSYTGELTVDFTIEPCPIKYLSFIFYDGRYTGNALKPKVTVKFWEMKLVEGTDYTIEVLDQEGNVVMPIHTGIYGVILSGMGNFEGSIDHEWHVQPLYPSDIATAQLIDLVETDNGFLPSFEVRIPPEQTVNEAPIAACLLEEGVDYTLEGDFGFGPGEQTAEICFMGDFAGSMPVSYTTPEYIRGSVTLHQEPMVYNGSPQIPNFSLAKGGEDLIPGKDYELIEELQPETNVGMYWISVRGIGRYYGEALFTWDIDPLGLGDCETTLSAETTVYPEIPELTVTFNGVELVPDVDYYVDEVRNQIGNSWIDIYGTRNFTNSRSVFWNSKDPDLSGMNTLKLPADLKRIEAKAFAGTDAQVIIIPGKCSEVDEHAFDDCEKLEVIVNHSNAVISAPKTVAILNDR